MLLNTSQSSAAPAAPPKQSSRTDGTPSYSYASETLTPVPKTELSYRISSSDDYEGSGSIGVYKDGQLIFNFPVYKGDSFNSLEDAVKIAYAKWLRKNQQGLLGGGYIPYMLDRMTYAKLCAIHKKLEETGRIAVRTDMKRDKDSLIKRILRRQSAPPKFPKYTEQGLSRLPYAEVQAIHKRFQDAGLITVRKDAKRTFEHLIDRILRAQIKK